MGKVNCKSNIFPIITGVEFLPPQYTMRFAVKLSFNTGETKVYTFNMGEKNFGQEAVIYHNYFFTNKIFANGYLKDNSLCFDNGFSISANELYNESKLLSEAKPCNETVYQDEKLSFKKVFEWKGVSLNYNDSWNGKGNSSTPNILKVMFDGKPVYNVYEGYATFCNWNGTRLINMDFHYISDFKEGLALVYVENEQDQSFYFMDETGKLKFRANYNWVDDFCNGYARVCRMIDGQKLYGFIDKKGQEVVECKYYKAENFYEGLAKVSTIPIDNLFQLYFYSDYDCGNWGWINSKGEEVIKPQYIFTLDFSEGLCGACKGEFYTEKDGRLAWKNTRWGFIDKNGNWVLPPVYGDMGYYWDDKFIEIYDDYKWNEDTALVGLYDMESRKVVFEPQFREIMDLEDDLFEVVFADDPQKRYCIIDINGKIIIGPQYRAFMFSGGKYISIHSEDGPPFKIGIIDFEGNEIIPPVYDIPFDSHYRLGKYFVYIENGKSGIRDISQKIIIPPKYDVIYGVNNLIIEVGIGE